MKTFISKLALATLCAATPVFAHAQTAQEWASCWIVLKTTSGSTPDVMLVLAPIAAKAGQINAGYTASLVAAFDKEVGISKEFPGHEPGNSRCMATPDRESAIATSREFIETNKRFGEIHSLDWAPGKKYKKSAGAESTASKGVKAGAAQSSSAPALTVKSTDTSHAGGANRPVKTTHAPASSPSAKPEPPLVGVLGSNCAAARANARRRFGNATVVHEIPQNGHCLVQIDVSTAKPTGGTASEQ